MKLKKTQDSGYVWKRLCHAVISVEFCCSVSRCLLSVIRDAEQPSEAPASVQEDGDLYSASGNLTSSADSAAGLQEAHLSGRNAAEQQAADIERIFQEHSQAAEAQQEAAHPGGWSGAGGLKGMQVWHPSVCCVTRTLWLFSKWTYKRAESFCSLSSKSCLSSLFSVPEECKTKRVTTRSATA